MTTYDWTALRTRRILMVAAVLLMFPGSCVAMPIDGAGATFGLGLAAFVAALLWIRSWPCPRCHELYAGKSTPPYVRPFREECLHCGLPGFTPTAEEAPPPVARTSESIGTKQKRLRLLADPRARVGLLLAIPLVWMTVCRLPSGERVRTVSGQEVEVLGIEHITQWTTGKGRRQAIVLSYYALVAPATIPPEEMLRFALPAVAATADSTVVLNQLRGDWWARAFGLRISWQHSYVLQSNGSWSQ